MQQEKARAQSRISNGKVAMVSGASRGIGAEIAKILWQEGYAVALLYQNNHARANEIVAQLGEDCIAISCDVADMASCEQSVAQAIDTFGKIDVLVCNAGIAQQKLFTDITLEDWAKMLGVNLTGAYHLCKLVLPQMIQRKEGRIITVSSMWGQVGASCEVHYSAAKAGLIGFTKALAKEEGPSGITVNCVCPGVIDTDMLASFSQEEKDNLAYETPLERLGTGKDVANCVAFLASDKASFITGQVFGVNGGFVI